MSKGSYSISMAQGRVAREHDLRKYQPTNADYDLRSRNIVIKQTSNYKEAFNELFLKPIEDYNEKQTRDDRKKSYDYYSEIQNGKGKEKAIYEYVLQIGNSDDLGVTDSSFNNDEWKALKALGKFQSASDYANNHLNEDEAKEELKEILIEQMKKLEERYPNFHFWTIVIHDDEVGGTCHAHIAFTPIAYGYKTGMAMRDSLTKALSQMGFESDKEGLSIQKWQNEVKDSIEKAMNEAGYERQHMGNAETHLSVSQFKLKCENERLVADKRIMKTPCLMICIHV